MDEGPGRQATASRIPLGHDPADRTDSAAIL